MRRLMRNAQEAGARLIHFPEGTTCWPNKRIMSESDPRKSALLTGRGLNGRYCGKNLKRQGSLQGNLSYGRHSVRCIRSLHLTGRITVYMFSLIAESW